MGNRCELVLDARARLAEGPVWHDDRLYWVDLIDGIVHQFDPHTGLDTSTSIGHSVGALAPRAAGGLLLATHDGFATLPAVGPGQQAELIAPVNADDPSMRMNDGGCDPRGRYLASTMGYDAGPGRGTLVRLDPDLSVTPLVEGLTIGNGLEFSADGTTMYFIDSVLCRVDAFDYDDTTGTPTNRRTVVQLPDDGALPDGMTIDEDGCLWVAMFDGGAVRRYRPDGTLDDVIEVPARQVTACAFGGDQLDELYITTGRNGLSGDDLRSQPQAGGIFRARVGVRGRPAIAFAG